MPTAIPRVTQALRAKRITETFRGSKRVYYLYRWCPQTGGHHLFRGTDHQRTAKLIVAQQEALGRSMIVFCAKPAHYITYCVYRTPAQGERNA